MGLGRSIWRGEVSGYENFVDFAVLAVIETLSVIALCTRAGIHG